MNWARTIKRFYLHSGTANSNPTSLPRKKARSTWGILESQYSRVYQCSYFPPHLFTGLYCTTFLKLYSRKRSWVRTMLPPRFYVWGAAYVRRSVICSGPRIHTLNALVSLTLHNSLFGPRPQHGSMATFCCVYPKVASVSPYPTSCFEETPGKKSHPVVGWASGDPRQKLHLRHLVTHISDPEPARLESWRRICPTTLSKYVDLMSSIFSKYRASEILSAERRKSNSQVPHLIRLCIGAGSPQPGTFHFPS